METDSYQRAREEERQRLLSTLSFSAMNQRETGIQEASLDTVNWVFSKTLPNGLQCNFRQWLQSDQKIFWITGKPGSGKSTLMKLVRNPQTPTYLRGSSVQILRYFFFELGNHHLQKQYIGCLRTLLYQILNQDDGLLDELILAQPEFKTKQYDNDWHQNELIDSLSWCLNSPSSKFCIFLDGLDEAQKDDRDAVVDLVIRLGSLPNVKVCVSSRPENLFKTRFGSNYASLRMQDLTNSAIETYVQNTLKSRGSSVRMTEQQYRDLVKMIQQKAEGVFLWVVLTLNELIQGIDSGNSTGELFTPLQELHPVLHRLYKQMWERRNGNQVYFKQQAAEIFWLACKESKSCFT